MCKKNTNAINWDPPDYFNISDDEILYIFDIISKIKWSKYNFHAYFKKIEEKLLIEFCNITNKYMYDIYNINYYLDDQDKKWRLLAFLRDYHDYRCGRDGKHRIRTDDCIRFIYSIKRYIKNSNLNNTVYRILRGRNPDLLFKHPLFVQFNKL